MKYVGGKSRIADAIAQQILNTVQERERERGFVSLFCGSCSVETRLSEHFKSMICNDSNEYLISLLKAVQDGYIPPDDVTEEQYRYVRKHMDEDKALTGFIGFGTTFGGKWFGGYAKPLGRNFAAEAKRALLRDNKKLQNATFTCLDYRDVELPEGCVIYADPPYDGTTGYGSEDFDSAAFWEYAREISGNHLMFISEQYAPEDFTAIWERPVTRTLHKDKSNLLTATEKLFIHTQAAIYAAEQ